MKLHYYPETDSLYIELKSQPGTETREVAEVTFDEKRKDLLACCSSSALAELRTRVALVASPIPPRTSGTMPRADFQQTTDWGVLAVDELGPAGRLVGGRGRT